MPQMWQPQESTGLRPFLRQDREKELKVPPKVKGAAQLSNRPRLWMPTGRFKDWSILTLSFCFFLSALAGGCAMYPDVQPESEKASQVFDVDERIIVKAISRVLKDRGFGNSRVEPDNSRLETEYVVEGDWRTKVVATIEKISPRKREVTLSIVTEKKTSSEWKPKKVMAKEQYDRMFGEIEMQIYRELSERR